jgi:cardiolipin synthase A/B
MIDWFLISVLVYILIVCTVCLRIIYDTNNATKTLAYLMLAVFIPILGMLFYFTLGINYRKRKLYSKKLITDEGLRAELGERIISRTSDNLVTEREEIGRADGLVKMLVKDSWSPLTLGNDAKLLVNGEEKFPELLEALRSAQHHIHIQYYIFDDDNIGTEIKNVLIEKATQGVKVRFIYDDFGSGSIRRSFVNELREAGVEAFPFNRIRWLFLANRINYRNHRRIVVIDGKTSFTGGINVSDRYINSAETETYWRDTHLRLDGMASHYLQYLFLCDWNFCAEKKMTAEPTYFRSAFNSGDPDFKVAVQVAASGPDSPTPTILFSLLKAIHVARKEILITTPYFIPGESILDALKVSSLSGVKVRLLVPYSSDSRLVNAASWSYYTDLLQVGVEIYLYKRGFVHAKTMVVDDNISVVGTANMDYRSFDLNFEVNTILYNKEIANQLRELFYQDMNDAQKIDPVRWNNRPLIKQLPERIARLLSPLL